MTPENLLYAVTHEWVNFETNSQGNCVATVGLSKFALEALTDLVFMELPEEGRVLAQGDVFGEIESVKAVSEMYAPVAGKVIAVNSAVVDHLESLADDPYENGWLVKIEVTDEAGRDSLLDYSAYKKQCESESH